MDITVVRWPLIEVTADKRMVRTKRRLQYLTCWVDGENPVVRGVIHVKFPGLQGFWDFRLKNGVATTESMRDYVISEESLTALRVRRDELKAKAS